MLGLLSPSGFTLCSNPGRLIWPLVISMRHILDFYSASSSATIAIPCFDTKDREERYFTPNAIKAAGSTALAL